MEFNFSLGRALKEVWTIYKKHFWFFTVISLVTVVLAFVNSREHVPALLSIVLSLISFVWSIVVVKFSLAATANKESELSLSKIKDQLVSPKKVLGFLGLAILMGLIIFVTFLPLILLGFFAFLGQIVPLMILGLITAVLCFWVIVRISFSTFIYLDTDTSIVKSIKASWKMTKGNVFWTVVLVFLMSAILYILGLAALVIGLLVTYPIVMLLMTKLYHSLSAYRGGNQTVVVQPVEILAPEPVHHEEVPVPKEHHESEEIA